MPENPLDPNMNRRNFLKRAAIYANPIANPLAMLLQSLTDKVYTVRIYDPDGDEFRFGSLSSQVHSFTNIFNFAKKLGSVIKGGLTDGYNGEEPVMEVQVPASKLKEFLAKAGKRVKIKKPMGHPEPGTSIQGSIGDISFTIADEVNKEYRDKLYRNPYERTMAIIKDVKDLNKIVVDNSAWKNVIDGWEKMSDDDKKIIAQADPLTYHKSRQHSDAIKKSIARDEEEYQQKTAARRRPQQQPAQEEEPDELEQIRQQNRRRDAENWRKENKRRQGAEDWRREKQGVEKNYGKISPMYGPFEETFKEWLLREGFVQSDPVQP